MLAEREQFELRLGTDSVYTDGKIGQPWQRCEGMGPGGLVRPQALTKHIPATNYPEILQPVPLQANTAVSSNELSQSSSSEAIVASSSHTIQHQPKPRGYDYFFSGGLTASDYIARLYQQQQQPFFEGHLHDQPVLWEPIAPPDDLPQSPYAQQQQRNSISDNATQVKSTSETRTGTRDYFNTALTFNEDGTVSVTEGLVHKNHRDETDDGSIDGSDGGGNFGGDGEGQKDLSRAISVATNNGLVIESTSNDHITSRESSMEEEAPESPIERATKRRRTGRIPQAVKDALSNTKPRQRTAKKAECTSNFITPSFLASIVPRAERACKNCRVSHLRCDKEIPSCRRCREGKKVCGGYAYLHERKRREQSEEMDRYGFKRASRKDFEDDGSEDSEYSGSRRHSP
ncbi:hypothetical protein N7G274_001621 [Stereocaulon virgatum]|uniref:Zn(2)-C6 fungal-type domain-containing protein n=1 Tax=Stereocaulon virgatum TaxID=373712 RepID=A0ABR4ANA9_9LECA